MRIVIDLPPWLTREASCLTSFISAFEHKLQFFFFGLFSCFSCRCNVSHCSPHQFNYSEFKLWCRREATFADLFDCSWLLNGRRGGEETVELNAKSTLFLFFFQCHVLFQNTGCLCHICLARFHLLNTLSGEFNGCSWREVRRRCFDYEIDRCCFASFDYCMFSELVALSSSCHYPLSYCLTNASIRIRTEWTVSRVGIDWIRNRPLFLFLSIGFCLQNRLPYPVGIFNRSESVLLSAQYCISEFDWRVGFCRSLALGNWIRSRKCQATVSHRLIALIGCLILIYCLDELHQSVRLTVAVQFRSSLVYQQKDHVKRALVY